MALPENLKVLLDAGADVDARDEFGRTVLMWAARDGTPENLKSVVGSAGADVNARYADGRTVLMRAADEGTPEDLKVLLDAGADASMKTAMGRLLGNFAQDNEILKDTDAVLDVERLAVQVGTGMINMGACFPVSRIVEMFAAFENNAYYQASKKRQLQLMVLF